MTGARQTDCSNSSSMDANEWVSVTTLLCSSLPISSHLAQTLGDDGWTCLEDTVSTDGLLCFSWILIDKSASTFRPWYNYATIPALFQLSFPALSATAHWLLLLTPWSDRALSIASGLKKPFLFSSHMSCVITPVRALIPSPF